VGGVGYYGSGTRMEMSGIGSITVNNLKGDFSKNPEYHNFN